MKYNTKAADRIVFDTVPLFYLFINGRLQVWYRSEIRIAIGLPTAPIVYRNFQAQFQDREHVCRGIRGYGGVLTISVILKRRF